MHSTHTSLLRRVRDPSDHASWGEFVALYEPLLLDFVRRRGLDEPDARDVVQGIFVALLRNLGGFELDHGKGRFRTWLWRVAHNAVVDWTRARRGARRAEETHRAMRQEVVSEADEDWATLHRRRILQFAMEKIRQETAARTWACFEQHLLRGRSGAEVAEIGLPANSVYVNAGRVLARVREQCLLYREDLDDE